MVRTRHKTVKDTADHYTLILPRLLEWEKQGVPQSEMVERLNDEGEVNSSGKPFNQPTISRILKRSKSRAATT